MALIKRVKKNVAKNPVARAFAKQELKRAITTQRICIFLLNDDEDVRDTMVQLALPVYAVMICMEAIKEDSPDMRKLKSGCSVLKEVSESGFKWRLAYAVTLDNALEICERRWSTFKPELLNEAIRQLESEDE